MNAFGQLEQGAAGGVDHRRLRRFDQLRIGFDRFFDRRNSCTIGGLAPMCRAERLAALSSSNSRFVHAHGVSVDRRTFEATGQRQDHARIDAAGQIRTHRHIRAQAFFDRLHHQLLELIHERFRIVAPLFFARDRENPFPSRRVR